MMQESRFTKAFIRNLTQAQPRVFAYVMTLLPDPEAAQDVLQETNTVLLEKADEYDESRDFVRWACGIARFKVLAYRRDRGRDRLVFSDAMMERLAEAEPVGGEQWDQRQRALRHCVDQLSERHRDMVAMRYGPGGSVAEIARRLGRSVNAVSVTLAKVRKALGECVRATMGREGDAI